MHEIKHVVGVQNECENGDESNLIPIIPVFGLSWLQCKILENNVQFENPLAC